MEKLEFNAEVDKITNDNKDKTTITFKSSGKDVDLNKLREMKELADVRLSIESTQTELEINGSNENCKGQMELLNGDKKNEK